MRRIYKIGEHVEYDKPNETSSNHVTLRGRITAFGSPCMSCAPVDEVPSYYVDTQYGPRIVCESVLKRVVQKYNKPVCDSYGSLMLNANCRNCGHARAEHNLLTPKI